jgi:asparagine synthase (glutamine-hydrolysing)
MSIIFGIREAAGHLVGENDLREVSRSTDHLAPDGKFLLTEGNVGMGFQPFYTHERSRLEAQPLADKRGNALLWDGRLDNFCELAKMLDLPGKTIPDSEIVLAAWRYWGESCFSMFIGEWALVLWSHLDRSLYLARDHAGTRKLYYELRGENVLWSSTLETLVSPSKRCALSEEFVARYLCAVPIGTYTPYRAIRAVPPGHFVRVRGRSADVHRHWDALRASPLAYKTDAEYEEDFFGLFRQSVERRAGKGASVLAELSGGMDSSAIVCMSDELRRKSGKAPSELIDTISYFDSSEPNWDERPFVSIVESRRGKTGFHVDLTAAGPMMEIDLQKKASPSIWPEDGHVISAEPAAEQGFRAVLSGLGGDELLGGIPTPLPELGDLLHGHRYNQLLSRSLAWCLSDRRALILRLYDVVAYRYSVYRREIVSRSAIPPWVTERCQTALGLSAEENLECSLGREMPPSAVSFMRAWWILLETLPRHKSGDRQRTEYRFPFLDRDLVEFLARVPREQLVRPGRRRSLMRRALRRIMPAEIIERRRKAFVIRRPILAIREHHSEIRRLFERSAAAELGYINRVRILRALDEFQKSSSIRSHRCLARAINLETWLQSMEGIE